ncbi:hypothetical protein [Acidithiobacillus marinus]|uniref:hypothetical protein n=1 Tax=Acidithiobacillus marinus TaxID=187490 RepID=UPI00117A31E2|nr:hypothetical protein [Acidithiobacillus marinus]
MYISHQAIGFFILFLLFWVFAYVFNHWLKSSQRHRRRTRSATPRRPIDAEPLSKLVGICLGDKAKAERLIAFEQNRNPRLSRLAAIHMAIDAVARDNRR